MRIFSNIGAILCHRSNRGRPVCDNGGVTATAEPDPRALHRAGLAVVAVCFVFNIFSRGIGDAFTVMVLPLEREFGWSRAQVTGIYSAYLLVSGLAGPLVGLLFERFGPRAVYTAGLAVAGLALVAVGTLERLWQFYLLIGLGIGIGVALLGMVPAAALLARWHSRRLSTVIGIVFSAMGMGAMVIVPIAQQLVVVYGWRGAYRVLGFVVLAVAVVQFLALPWRRFAAGDPKVRATRAAGADGDHWTVRKAMATPIYWGMVRVFLFTSMGMYIVLVEVVAYLIDLGMAPLAAASSFGVMGMLSVASVMSSGVLADRFGTRATAMASFAGTLLGLCLFFALSFDLSLPLLAACVVVFGLCQGARGPLVSSIAAKRFAGRGHATIYGTILATNAIGAAVGSLAAGFLHDLTGGYRASFVFALISISLAALPFFTVRELREAR
jgi:MFS family permease